LLSLKNVSKKFINRKKEFIPLDDVTFDVYDNEFLCLLGPSGCGKSTILKLISGLIQKDSGSITLENAEITKPGSDRGMVFQDYALFPWLNVEHNIAIGLEITSKKSKAEIREKVKWAVSLVNLTGFEKHHPHQLSGGMKQRVAIARVLVMDSKILLMDEPFGALDAFTRMQLQDDLITLCEKHRFTTVFVTHDVDEAVYLADRIVVMTPPPGKVKAIVKVPLSRPRMRTADDFSHIRNHVLEQYGYKDTRSIEYQL